MHWCGTDRKWIFSDENFVVQKMCGPHRSAYAAGRRLKACVDTGAAAGVRCTKYALSSSAARRTATGMVNMDGNGRRSGPPSAPHRGGEALQGTFAVRSRKANAPRTLCFGGRGKFDGALTSWRSRHSGGESSTSTWGGYYLLRVRRAIKNRRPCGGGHDSVPC